MYCQEATPQIFLQPGSALCCSPTSQYMVGPHPACVPMPFMLSALGCPGPPLVKCDCPSGLLLAQGHQRKAEDCSCREEGPGLCHHSWSS